MADYHRFVAYIYEYVNGKKMQNTGFAKIELRNAICRIQIHIQNVRMLDGKTEVFGIVRQPKESGKNNPIILLIGEGQTQGSGFDRRFTVPEEPFVEESCRFEQVCGIYIRSQSGRNWMTVFDDEPIAIENLGKPEEIKAETDEENVKKSETDKEAVEENETDKENVGIKENEKSEKSTESEADQELQEETVENESKEVSEATKEEIEQAEKPEKPEKPELSEENINLDIPKYVKAEPEITSEEIKEGTSKEAFQEEMAKEMQENKCQGCEPGTDTRWNRATARYIHFQPVQDEKIEDAIRIQPSDLKILWQKGLRQGSNSFLMHGYYQHQHLMIGKSKEGGYILGIPGFYGEKNMAEMFGFPEFRRAKAERTSEIKEQTFGYWCKNLI